MQIEHNNTYMISNEGRVRLVEAGIKSAQISKAKKEARIAAHNKACERCGALIGYEKRRNRFCSKSCSASTVNIGVRKHGNPKTTCKVCGNKTKSSVAIYCSQQCHKTDIYTTFIVEWKSGNVTGLSSGGVVCDAVKRYLREKYNNKCCLCGWSEVNPTTGKVPLVADHIDGNWENNSESNLRLICCNCDSIGPTYKALNKGRGRSWRRNP